MKQRSRKHLKITVKVHGIKFPMNAANYVKDNWGAPFIVGFMGLLMVAAVSLLTDFIVLAEEVAVYAYYALVTGVALQLICFLRDGKRNGDPTH